MGFSCNLGGPLSGLLQLKFTPRNGYSIPRFHKMFANVFSLLKKTTFGNPPLACIVDHNSMQFQLEKPLLVDLYGSKPPFGRFIVTFFILLAYKSGKNPINPSKRWFFIDRFHKMFANA